MTLPCLVSFGVRRHLLTVGGLQLKKLTGGLRDKGFVGVVLYVPSANPPTVVTQFCNSVEFDGGGPPQVA